MGFFTSASRHWAVSKKFYLLFSGIGDSGYVEWVAVFMRDGERGLVQALFSKNKSIHNPGSLEKINMTNCICPVMIPLSFHSLKRKLELLKPEVEVKFKVKSIGLFGSYVRGEQKATSDLDILVDFYEPIKSFQVY